MILDVNHWMLHQVNNESDTRAEDEQGGRELKLCVFWLRLKVSMKAMIGF